MVAVSTATRACSSGAIDPTLFGKFGSNRKHQRNDPGFFFANQVGERFKFSS